MSRWICEHHRYGYHEGALRSLRWVVSYAAVLGSLSLLTHAHWALITGIYASVAVFIALHCTGD